MSSYDPPIEPPGASDIQRQEDKEHYNKLNYKEIEKIAEQIDHGMRTINGDTAPIEITARQAAILLWTWANSERPSSEACVFADVQYMLKETPDERSPYE